MKGSLRRQRFFGLNLTWFREWLVESGKPEEGSEERGEKSSVFVYQGTRVDMLEALERVLWLGPTPSAECHRRVWRQNSLNGFCFRNIILEIAWQVEWTGKKLKIKEHKTGLQKTWWEMIALIFWLPKSDSLRSPWEKGDFFTWKLDVEIVKTG